MKRITELPLLVKVIIAIGLGIGIGLVAPDIVVRAMNTFCGIFSQFLGFMIPFIIVGLVTPAIANVGNTAGKLLCLTALLAYLFTSLSGLFAYCFSTTLFPSFIDGGDVAVLSAKGNVFQPFFSVTIPPIMDVMTALVLSFMLGIGIAVTDRGDTLRNAFNELEQIVMNTIAKAVIPLLPLFIMGLFMDMTASGKVGPVLKAFVSIIGIIFIMTVVLLVAQFCIAGIVVRRNPLRLLYNMLPAYFTALGTASSAATIPVTLRQVQKNGVRDEIAGFVVPLCATIHMSGSALKIVSCAVALMLINGMEIHFTQVLSFILMLGITMIAAPGVPGGAIMSAIGLLASILGFDSNMQGMMIALYIAMDSFGTACNVTGDGAVALIMNRISRG